VGISQRTAAASAPKTAANPPAAPACTRPAALLGTFAAELVEELGEELLECDEVDEDVAEEELLLAEDVVAMLDEPVVDEGAADEVVVPAVADEARPPATVKEGE
jgi:pyruvate/2-oxoglutarate dehydrogenase complex dihydrolipoamide acyltransferase (E2) component